MASVIHGSSWGALTYFRKRPAALSVFWLYCARANSDNVAWPSEGDMRATTGWSEDSCRLARQWLIEVGALEEVADYVRPAWRRLPEEKQAERRRFDRAIYCRPTGIIQLEGQMYPLLYDAQREGMKLPDEGDRQDTGMVTSPGDYTTKEIKAAALTTDQWQMLLQAERKGKKRRTVIDAAISKIDSNGALQGELFEAIVLAFDWDIETLNDVEAGRVRKAAKLLAQSRVQPEEVKSLAAYVQRFDNAGVMALPGHVQAWRKQHKPQDGIAERDDPQQEFFAGLDG